MAQKIEVKFKVTRKRVYHFDCLECQKKSQTVIKKRLRLGLCRNCRRQAKLILPGQIPVFPEVVKDNLTPPTVSKKLAKAIGLI